MTHLLLPRTTPRPEKADQRLKGVILWLLISLALGLPAILLPTVPLDSPPQSWPTWAQNLVLRPSFGLDQPPWVWWSAAWLHGSVLHLTRNLLALLALLILAWFARVPSTMGFEWCLCWPLTQLGMLHQNLSAYVGLSGVLHAGATLISLRLMGHAQWSQRWIGLTMGSAIALKLVMENPWQHALIHLPGSDINVAPWAHFSGAASAVLVHTLTFVTNRARSVKRSA